MKKSSNYKSVWDITSQSEKERIFSKFLQEYGENYTQDEFVKFLKKRYGVTKQQNSLSDIKWRQGY